jgi:hypothetical protein
MNFLAYCRVCLLGRREKHNSRKWFPKHRIVTGNMERIYLIPLKTKLLSLLKTNNLYQSLQQSVFGFTLVYNK